MRQDKQKLARGVSKSFYMWELVTDFRTYTPPFLASYFGPQWLDMLELDYVICHMVSRLTNLVMSWSQG